jgi:hypothetical protein
MKLFQMIVSCLFVGATLGVDTAASQDTGTCLEINNDTGTDISFTADGYSGSWTVPADTDGQLINYQGSPLIIKAFPFYIHGINGTVLGTNNVDWTPVPDPNPSVYPSQCTRLWAASIHN